MIANGLLEAGESTFVQDEDRNDSFVDTDACKRAQNAMTVMIVGQAFGMTPPSLPGC